ncbi:MAG TPA: hypothetical protein VGB45_12805, partial [Abditibacterium sp.]
MKPKMGREIALLTVPLLIIGGVALWSRRDDAPEDLWSGKARIVTRVRQLPITPFDVYRGYTHRLAVDGWTAGELPPVPPRRAGTLKTSRIVSQRIPPLAVAFRQGEIWKSTLPSDELPAWGGKEKLRKNHVAPDVASLWVERAEGTGKNREKFLLSFLLRLPETPPVGEAVLKGKIEVDLEDGDTRMIGGVLSDRPVKQHPLASDELRVPVEIRDDALSSNFAREPEWKVKSVTTMPPVGIGVRQATVHLKLKCITNGVEAVRTQIIKARLMDAKGREVGEPNGYGSGMGILAKGEQNVDS